MDLDDLDRLDVLRCASLYGDACDVVPYRHNRAPAMRVALKDVEGIAARLRTRRDLLDEILTINLSPVERRTWRRLHPCSREGGRGDADGDLCAHPRLATICRHGQQEPFCRAVVGSARLR